MLIKGAVCYYCYCNNGGRKSEFGMHACKLCEGVLDDCDCVKPADKQFKLCVNT